MNKTENKAVLWKETWLGGQVLPESRNKMSDWQSPLRLVSAGLKHLPQDVKTPQSHQQLPQHQLAHVVVQHFAPQYSLQGLGAGVRLRALAQIQQARPLVAVQLIHHLSNRPELIHAREIRQVAPSRFVCWFTWLKSAGNSEVSVVLRKKPQVRQKENDAVVPTSA